MANRYTLTEQQKLVDYYLKCCVNFYGYVTPRQFLKVYNRYNSPKIKKEDLLRWADKLERHSYDSYTIYSNAIVNNKVPKEKINQIVYFQEGKKFFTPTEQEILSYIDFYYYEKNIYSNALYSFLVNTIKTNFLVAEEFVAKISLLIRIEEPMSVQCILIENFGIEPKDIDEASILLEHIKNLNNNSRKWANCGYTPREIYEGHKNS